MRNSLTSILNVFESVEHDLMGVLVVSKLLFFLCNVDSYLDCLGNISNSSVEFKCPLRFFGDVVGLSQQVVYQLVSKGVHLDFSYHFDHVWDHTLSLLNVELESLAELVTSLVMFSSTTTIVLAFIECSNFQVLVGVAVIHL